MAVNNISIWDYLVFSLVLAISAGIGIFYGFFKGRNKTTAEFLMANRQMGVLPITLSLLASFMSAITLLGRLYVLKYSNIRACRNHVF